MDEVNSSTELVTPSEETHPMQTFEALRIIQQLTEGTNPLSEEALPTDHFCLNSDIHRALQASIPALESRLKWIQRQAQLPANAGKPWLSEEEDSLTVGFDNGDDIDTLANRHQRTIGSITSRLIKIGKISA